MAKKSAAARHGGAPRRPTTSGGGSPKRPAADQGRVSLVRAPSTSSATVTDDAPATSAAEPRPATAKSDATGESKAVSRPAASAPAKPASSSPARPAAAVAAASTAARLPSARAPQRTARPQIRSRASSLVTPEHYAYVRNDLIRTAVLAATMFVIIVIAYLYLHAQGQA